MAKKNRLNKLFDKEAIEPSDTHSGQGESVEEQPVLPEAAGTTDSGAADPSNEPIAARLDSPEEATGEQSEDEESSMAGSAEDSSADDILDDVRRSLIEEELDKNKQESKWWRRIGRKKEKKPEPEDAPVEIELPTLQDEVELREQGDQQEEEIDDIEDLIHMLNVEEVAQVESTIPPEQETPVESEPEIDFEELKRQAFQARAENEEAERISDVRSIALEGGEEVLVEVETKTVDPMQERLSAVENAFKPYRRYIYTAFALLGVAMAVTASLILFNVYQRSRPTPVSQPSNLPYPTSVSLPGGWSFQLGQGAIQNGKWEPRGAEWLTGTEVCRWVALPWSTQLEAVIRTLNPKDPIELYMSNNDKLVYEVYSIRQLTPQEMQQLDSNSPCLLLILTQSDSEERWVLTALP